MAAIILKPYILEQSRSKGVPFLAWTSIRMKSYVLKFLSIFSHTFFLIIFLDISIYIPYIYPINLVIYIDDVYDDVKSIQ